jgi:hypothetical protein
MLRILNMFMCIVIASGSYFTLLRILYLICRRKVVSAI